MNVQDLFPHEVECIVHAIRRDMRAEMDKAATDPTWKDHHLENVRRDRDLLDVLNPKRTMIGD